MLAVITEVTVKLIPKPQLGALHHGQLRRHRTAGAAVASVIADGIIPAGLEMMDKPMTAAVEDFVHAGYDLDAAAILLCESDGTPEEVDEEIGRMTSGADGERRHAHRGQPRRGAAPEVLERAQERLPGLRPHQPRLHVHGLDHPAQAPGRHAAGDSADGDASTTCAASTSSMPATAICIR